MSDPMSAEVWEATPDELRRARTEVVLQALKRVLGPDNVDRYEDDEFRVGVSLADGQFFDVSVTPDEPPKETRES